MKKLVLFVLWLSLTSFVVAAQQPPATNGGAPTPVAAVAPAAAAPAPKPPTDDFLRDYDYAVTLDRAAQILKTLPNSKWAAVNGVEEQRDELLKKLRTQVPPGHDFNPQRRAWVPVKQEAAPQTKQ